MGDAFPLEPVEKGPLAELKALQLEPMHGWGITERIVQWSESVLQLGQGTLYPALYRLERRGLVQSEWKVSENNRRARYYSLTRVGRRHLSDELAQWRRMSRAVNMVLEATMLDWRLGARQAAAYDLLSRARLEVVTSPGQPATD